MSADTTTDPSAQSRVISVKEDGALGAGAPARQRQRSGGCGATGVRGR